MTALSTAETALRRAPDDPGVPVTVSGAEAAALAAELDRLRSVIARVQSLTLKWDRDHETYPVKVFREAQFAAKALEMCTREVRSALRGGPDA